MDHLLEWEEFNLNEGFNLKDIKWQDAQKFGNYKKGVLYFPLNDFISLIKFNDHFFIFCGDGKDATLFLVKELSGDDKNNVLKLSKSLYNSKTLEEIKETLKESNYKYKILSQSEEEGELLEGINEASKGIIDDNETINSFKDELKNKLEPLGYTIKDSSNGYFFYKRGGIEDSDFQFDKNVYASPEVGKYFIGLNSKIETSSVSLADPRKAYQTTSARRVTTKKIKTQEFAFNKEEVFKFLDKHLQKISKVKSK